MIEFEKPTISKTISDDGTYGKFVVEPLQRGYGLTLGNCLRRILLSSLPGAAVTSVKIDGILHEKGVRVIPSQANYVMVELENGISPKELLKTLLIKYNLLIKELTSKTNNGRNYLRLAVRNTEDNDALLAAMRAELE